MSAKSVVDDTTKAGRFSDLHINDDIFARFADAICIASYQTTILTANPAFSRITGFTTEEVRGQLLTFFIGVNEASHTYNQVRALVRQRGFWHGETYGKRKDGSLYPIRLSVSAIQATGKSASYLISFSDITGYKAMEASLVQSEQHYRTLAEIAPVGIFQTDSAGDCLYVNNKWCEIAGLGADEAKGQGWVKALHPDDAQRVGDEWYRCTRAHSLFKMEYRFLRPDGQIRWVLGQAKEEVDINGDIVGYVGCVTDITHYRAAQEEIARLTKYDMLTGLLNRRSAQECLDKAITVAQRKQHMVAVIFTDLDRFKTVNKTLGHTIGDSLVREAASRLSRNMREDDILGRIGGDDFVVIVPNARDIGEISKLAAQIQLVLGAPYAIQEHVLHTSANIGIACYPADGQDSETIMKNAEVALQHIKAQGSGFQFYTAQMNQAAARLLLLEHDLRQAIEADQLVLHYQPQIDNKTGKVVGVEALVRWNHPQQQMLSPTVFIPLAEKLGLIDQLGEWVLDKACAQLQDWKQQGLRHLRMAVNLSARQLASPTFISFVETRLESYGLCGNELELEVTESVMMEDPQASISQLKALQALGVHLSIDDFGTGYSSLSYLTQLPIHALKLDRSFVQSLETDASAATVCAATIALAHNLGLTVIAEGVEQASQHEFLIKHNCDVSQGFLFSKPLPASATFDYIANMQ